MNGTEPRPAVAPPTPEIPGELWMLWSRKYNCWVTSDNVALGGTTYLVAMSEHEAQAAAARQNEEYRVDCVPVRVK